MQKGVRPFKLIIAHAEQNKMRHFARSLMLRLDAARVCARNKRSVALWVHPEGRNYFIRKE